jgi:Tfp pilus assembly protein PilO
MATTSTTALMPIDPALTTQQVSRIPAIRANLLPSEITSGRNARRTRFVLVGAVILVALLLGLWYVYAVQQKSAADKDLAAATEQVQATQKRKNSYNELTSMITQQEAIAAKLASLLAADLPWAATLDKVRSTGTAANVTIAEMTGSLNSTSDATTANSKVVGTIALSGSAADKKTIANFVDDLATLDGIANPYLTVANEEEDTVNFTLTAEITTDARCGRYTTPCKTGGN